MTYKQIKSLKTKRGRDWLGLFTVEGEKFVNEIPEDWSIVCYVIADHFAHGHDCSDYHNRAVCLTLRDSIFDALSDTVAPQGIMAVCKQKCFNMADLIKPNCFLLLGECLSDPGNIGTLIRTACAANADGVILTQGSADIFNPKTLRAAAGAVLHIPVVKDEELTSVTSCLKNAGVHLYAAHVKGTITPYTLDLKRSFCFMVGNESHGLSDSASAAADALVKLPMPGPAESLNASIAGGILIYEAVRQRLCLTP